MENISSCPEDLARWYCLNGATCFEVKIGDSALYNCWCLSGYHGLRCDYKYSTSGVERATRDNLEPNSSSSLSSEEASSKIEATNQISRGNESNNSYQKLPFITRDDMIALGRKPFEQHSARNNDLFKGSVIYNIPLVILIVLISIVLIVK